MNQRDHALILRIGDETDAFVRGEFGLADYCEKLDMLLTGLHSGSVRGEFRPARMALQEVNGAVCETRGFYHTFDAGLEAWAVAQIEALVGRFGQSRSHRSPAGF